MGVYKIIFLVTAALLLSVLGFLHRELVWSLRFASTRAADYPIQRLEIPPCPRCNLILISMDTLRADRLGFMGDSSGLSPRIDQIAGRSLVFDQAFANAFYTTPSHMTVFTSLYPQQHHVMGSNIKVPRIPRGGDDTALSDKVETLAERLKSAGYATTWVGPLNLKHLDSSLGFARGFDLRLPPAFSRAVEEILDPSLAFDATRVMQRLIDPAPQFAFIHSFVTHMPFVTTREGAPKLLQAGWLLQGLADEIGKNPERFGLDDPRAIEICSDPKRGPKCWNGIMDRSRYFHNLGQWQHQNSRKISELERQQYREAYGEQVRRLDTQIGLLWDQLEAAGLLKNSVIAFFSDHGEELFEHGRASHSSFYEHTLHVPLFIYHPLVDKGVRLHNLVSLVDLMPSLLAWLGLPPSAQAQGQNMLERNGGPVLGFSLGNSFVRDRNWKLIRWYDGREELFYLPLDPAERDNLIDLKTPWSKSAYRDLIQALVNLESNPGF